VAVVQISKIQHRRGRIGETELPQLASAEFGWAIDTQQLYIGNGSVDEGAPAVGNTEILTENSNIFDLLGQYTFKGNTGATVQTGEFSTTPVQRTIQQRLDDLVTVQSFGVVGDGVTDDTEALQRAIDEVFLNSSDKIDPKSRRTLKIEAGEYRITSTLYVPPFANIIGDGKDKTIIKQYTNDTPIMATIDGTSIPSARLEFANIQNTTRPRNITISGITFAIDTSSVTENSGLLMLDCTTESTISDCKFYGNHGVRNGNTGPTTTGINIRGLGATTSENDIIDNCEFNSLTYGVYSKYDTQNIIIQNSNFKYLHTGIDLARDSTGVGAESQGPRYYTFKSNLFDKVDDYGIAVHNTTGEAIGHTSDSNTFLDVANNSNGQNSPQTSVILFDTVLNSSVGDSFEREEYINKTGAVDYSEIPFKPLVSGYSYTHSRVNEKRLEEQSAPVLFTKVPFEKETIVYLDYVLVKTSGSVTTRRGRITLTVNSSGVVYSDSYSHTGSDDGGVNFTAVLDDYDSTAGSETIKVMYTNPVGEGEATVRYAVSYFA